MSVFSAFSQNPDANFSIPAAGCLGETIMVQNQSTQSLRYEWDLCQGDLNLTPLGAVAGNVTGSNIPTGVDVVYDGTTWYAFITSRNAHSIIRVNLGADMNSFGSVVNLGNASNLLSFPTDIKIVSENGNWYGFIYNEGPNVICRLDFGTALTNIPTATALINSATGTGNQGLDVIKNGTQWQVVYTLNSKIGVLRLPTIQSIPAASDQLLTNNLTGNPSLCDIKLLTDQGNFYAYTCASSAQQLFKLSFGTDVFSQPTETNISSSLPSSGLTYYGVDGARDEGKSYLFLSTIQGSIVRINLGADLSQNPVSGQSLGNLGVFSANLKTRLVKHESNWVNFSVDYTNGNFFKGLFPAPTCQYTPGLLTAQNPQLLFGTSGVKYISLRSFNGGAFDEEHRSITISSQTAPSIDFTNQKVCLQSPIEFTYTSDQSILSQDWDFGDGQTSTSLSPQNTYAAAGAYDVKLNITSSVNGCNNTQVKNIEIYSESVAGFTLPSGLLCSNNDLTFLNTTPDNFDGNLTYQWLIDNQPVSTARDLVAAFSSVGSHDVTLQTFIPGCSDEVMQSVAGVLEGPITDFSFAGQCEDENVTFTNSSSGTIDTYSWNFDDGTSNIPDTNPTHVFSAIGVYDVVLTASNTTTGCNNTKTKSVSVYSKPLVNFLLSPPPFSCNGTPSQFNDLTPNPPDSNIASWAWNFGDAGSGQNTSAIKNPQHTYANPGGYNVSLLVSTNFLCSASIQLPITISQSPVANFSNTATCEDVPVNFSDASVGTISSWNWTIGSTVYNSQNPTHTFNNPVNTSATLNVTASNGCIGTVNKPMVVPVKLTPDFSVNRNCVNQQTVFTDITNGAADPVSSQRWTFGTLGTGSGSPINFTFPNTGSVPVALTVTTQTGCVYPISKSVNIIPSPQANFTPSPLAGAPPLSVLFTNASINATSYQWAFHDQNNSTSTAVSPTFVYQVLGEYQAELTASNAQNCFHTMSKTIRVVQPVLDVALDGLELIEFQNGFRPAVTIFNHGNVPIINLSLLLNLSGPVIREHVNAIITPNTSYRHVFSFEFPATTDIDYFCIEAEVTDMTPNDNEVCLGLEQSFVTFPPYPNPSKGSFQLDWILKEPGTVSLTVINSMGQEERNLQIESEEGRNPLILETYGLSAGVYFVRIKYQQFMKVYRVFVSE